MARNILARHGMSDHKCAFMIYKKRDRYSIASTTEAVCEYYGYTLDEATKTGNKSEYARVRQMLAHCLYNFAGLNDNHIAMIIKRDRSTIIYSRKCISHQIPYDRKLLSEIEFIHAHIAEKNRKTIDT